MIGETSLPSLDAPLCTYSTSFRDLCNLTLVKESPPHFPTRGAPLTTEPSLSHVAQAQDGVVADGEAEFELGDNFTANATRDARSFLGVRMAHMPQGWVNSCASQPATVSSECRPSAEVFLPLDCIEDQASSRSTVRVSGSTATQRIETVLGVESAVEGSGQIRSGKRPVPHENRKPPTRIHAMLPLKIERVMPQSRDIL